MKQYNLKISHDQDAESPRNYDCNLGFFLTNERRNISPDQNEDLKNIILKAYEQSPINADEHIKKSKGFIKKNLVKI